MRRATAIALTVTGYLGLALVLTWPLGAVIATELPRVADDFVSDLYLAGWALAWQAHALVTQPTEIANANIYGGVPRALFYGTPGFGMLPVYAPLFFATGNPTLALNGTILGLLALTAAALHAVVRSWTGSHLAGVAAGTTFLASKAALVMCAIMPQYAALAPLPAIVWLVARPALARGATLGLAALVALQALTDLVYVALPVVAILGLAGAIMCLRARSRGKGMRVLVALGLAVLALSPVYVQYAGVRAANPDLATQSVWRSAFFDLVDSRTGLPLGHGPLALDPVALVPALAGFLLAATGVVPVSAERARAWRHAWFWFLASFTGAWVLPLQYPAFRDFVLGSVVRDFLRLGLSALIAACLLTGLGFAACSAAATARVRPSWRWAVAPALAALVVAFRIGHSRYLPGDYPTHPAPSSGPEAAILRAGTGPVLVLPVGDPRKDVHSHATAMYRSIGHWRPLLNGYASYYPRGFRERMELARRLPDGDVLDTLRRDTRLTGIVVHAQGMPELTIGRWRAAIAAGTLPGVRIDHDDGEVMVLAIDSRGW
jgi:hypothetical protein